MARSVLLTEGSIPACAGDTPPVCCCPIKLWVYPRVCGGYSRRILLTKQWKGLSPRVRGIQSMSLICFLPPRSIPACAGDTMQAGLRPHKTKVYPRVCGGYVQALHIVPEYEGLSPRVRGILLRLIYHSLFAFQRSKRIIFAC